MKENGILDPEGKYKNPLTGKSYQKVFDFNGKAPRKDNEIDYRYIARTIWTQLPMYQERIEVINLIKKHQVLIINGGTGAGKTVILPKLALHAIDYKGKVVMTVPKKAPALSAASFAAKCLDVELGQEVGFQFKGAKINVYDDEGDAITKDSKSSKTKLLFSTDGSVVQQLVKDPLLKEFDVVIIDEAHERSVNIDLLILYLREALLKNNKLKLIVTSATLPEGLFENYFQSVGLDVYRKELSSKPNKPVEVFYTKEDVPVNKRANKIIELYRDKIIKTNDNRDSLIFTTSNAAAKTMCKKIKQMDKNVYCVEATSATVEKDPDIPKRFDEMTLEQMLEKGLLAPNTGKRLLVATKIYESSVTLSNLIFVFDNGVSLEQDYDPLRMEEQLNTTPISKAQAKQRLGRAGRTQPGICYHSYSKKQYDAMLLDPIVPILKSNITDNIFKLLNRPEIENLSDLLIFLRKFMQVPKPEFVMSSLRTLNVLGLISGLSGEDTITEKGEIVMEINNRTNNINNAVALYYAKIYKCNREMAFILGAMANISNLDDIFVKPEEMSEMRKMEEIKRSFKQTEGDTFSLYEIVRTYLRNEYRYGPSVITWCKKNYLNYNKLKKIRESARDYSRINIELDGEGEFEIPDIKDRIVFCLLKGYLNNIAVNTGRKQKVKKDILPVFKNFFPEKITFAPLSADSYVTGGNYIIYQKLFSMDNERSFMTITKVNKDFIKILTEEEKMLLNLKMV